MRGVFPYLTLVLASFFTLEAIVRIMSLGDADGNHTFRSLRLKPYRLPVHYLEKTIASYTHSDRTGPIYDAELGWALRPGVLGHNSEGFVTTGPVPEKTPRADMLRVGLVGDSFTQGNFQWGWWRLLENELHEAGTRAEVLNFGVSGYGMDQTYLRMHRDCLPWKPQVVIYGFLADACTRNLNLFRVLRDNTTGIPFMKPRFVLEAAGLRLVNSPVPAPGELLGICRDLSRWDGLAYEHFYRPRDYQMLPWRHSRLLAVAEAQLAPTPTADFYQPEGESGQIALRLLRRMKEEAEAIGAEFIVVYLPSEIDLERLRNFRKPPEADLLRIIEQEFTLVRPEQAFLELANGKEISEFFGDGHYKPEFDALVAQALCDRLVRRPALPKRSSSFGGEPDAQESQPISP